MIILQEQFFQRLSSSHRTLWIGCSARTWRSKVLKIRILRSGEVFLVLTFSCVPVWFGYVTLLSTKQIAALKFFDGCMLCAIEYVCVLSTISHTIYTSCTSYTNYTGYQLVPFIFVIPRFIPLKSYTSFKPNRLSGLPVAYCETFTSYTQYQELYQ